MGTYIAIIRFILTGVAAVVFLVMGWVFLSSDFEETKIDESVYTSLPGSGSSWGDDKGSAYHTYVPRVNYTMKAISRSIDQINEATAGDGGDKSDIWGPAFTLKSRADDWLGATRVVPDGYDEFDDLFTDAMEHYSRGGALLMRGKLARGSDEIARGRELAENAFAAAPEN